MKKPKTMKPGSLIEHGYLNDLRDYGVNSVRVGPGMVGNLSGGRSAVSVPRRGVARVGHRAWYYAKVTASSSSVSDITLAEVDSAGAVITGGRAPIDAKVPNERKGVPVDTFGIAFELPPTVAGGDVVTKFAPWDGITTSPKTLIGSGATADTTDWDIEVDSQPVVYLPVRVFDDTATSGNWYIFRRQVRTDGSGMVVYVSGETRDVLPGDGYNETRHNNVLVDLIPSNGVLDFDDDPLVGTDELPITWVLTPSQDADAGEEGNDELRTKIQGFVDVSSVTAGSGGAGQALNAVKWVTIEAGTVQNTEYVLDGGDWAGRSIQLRSHYNDDQDVATINTRGVDSWTEYSVDIFAGVDATGEQTIMQYPSGINMIIDCDDAGMLKLKATSATPTPVVIYLVIYIEATDQISAATDTMT